MEQGQKRREKCRLGPRVLPGTVANFADVICRPVRRVQPPSGPKITAYRKRAEIMDVLNDGDLLPPRLPENTTGNNGNVIVQNPRLRTGFFLRFTQTPDGVGIVKSEGGLLPVRRRLRAGPFRALENGLGKTGVLGENPRDFLRCQLLATPP